MGHGSDLWLAVRAITGFLFGEVNVFLTIYHMLPPTTSDWLLTTGKNKMQAEVAIT